MGATRGQPALILAPSPARRNAGGFDKTPTAYAEFLWADFFRPRVVIGPTPEDFDNAVAKALALASSGAAAQLPGYKGPAKA